MGPSQFDSFLFWSIRTQRLGQFVLIWSMVWSWSARTHDSGQFVSFWGLCFGKYIRGVVNNSITFTVALKILVQP